MSAALIPTPAAEPAGQVFAWTLPGPSGPLAIWQKVLFQGSEALVPTATALATPVEAQRAAFEQVFASVHTMPGLPV